MERRIKPAQGEYKRDVGSQTFRFDSSKAREPANPVESEAVARVMEQLLSRESVTFNVDADRCFRRWLGKSHSVDAAVEIAVDGVHECVILSIERTTHLFVFAGLRIRLIGDRSKSAEFTA
jgi:hypothetical protein